MNAAKPAPVVETVGTRLSYVRFGKDVPMFLKGKVNGSKLNSYFQDAEGFEILFHQGLVRVTETKTDRKVVVPLSNVAFMAEIE